MQNFLRFNGLLSYVDGTLPQPSKPKPTFASSSSSSSSSADTTKSDSSTSYDDWLTYDSFVTAYITATLFESLVHQALGFNTTRALWVSLEESYLQQSLARRSLLRSQLHTIRKENLSIAEYFQKISSLSSSLSAIGDPVSNSDLVLIALDGLPLAYRPFITTIENLEHTPTFGQLRAKLLMHEQRVLLDDSSSSLDDTTTHALVSQHLSNTSPPNAFYARNINNSSDHFSNVVNHAQSSSNKFHQSQNASVTSKHNVSSFPSSRKYRGTCQICRKQGHSASRCRYRYTPSQKSGLSSQFAGYHTQQSALPPLLPTPSSQAWIPDSGATSHMTCDPALIQQIHPYAGSD